MIEFGIGVAVFGIMLVVLCSPQRDAILWRLPKFAHRLIRWLSGYELAECSSWSINGPRYVRWYEWRKIRRT
jgi:hypothetical protein